MKRELRRAKVEVYNGIVGHWYWRLKATNGRIIADGAEGYVRQSECLRAVDRVCKAFGGDIKQLWVVIL